MNDKSIGRIGAVVAFFNPCRYRRTVSNLRATLSWLCNAFVDVAVVQAVLPGQNPEPVAPSCAQACFESESVLFRKENLWNIGAGLLLRSDAFLFVDGDIEFRGHPLARSLSHALSGADIVQPYEFAEWTDKAGDVVLRRRSAGVSLAEGSAPVLGRYHPGFAWAMRRTAFESIGGFYDRNAVGGGDAMFAYSLSAHRPEPTQRAERASLLYDAPSYVRYRARVQSQRLTVSYCGGVVARHMWHGDRSDRKYLDRGAYTPAREAGELPLEYRDDGLLEWTKSEHSDGVMRYFASRREDD